MYVVID